MSSARPWMAGVGILLVLAGLGVWFGWPDGARSSKACAGLPVSVTVPPTTEFSSTVTVHVACPPQRGDEFILIVELPEVGADHHPLYLTKVYMGVPAVGDYTYPHNVSMSPVGTSRVLYVIEVPAAVAASWKAQFGVSEQLALPPHARVVSNRAPNVRVVPSSGTQPR